MQSFEGFRKSGTFTIAPGTDVQGELILNGNRTTLDLHSNEFFDTRSLVDDCITGMFHDRSKVSLIHCMTTQGLGSGFRADEHYHFGSVFPHFAVFGDVHISSSDKRIKEIRFLIDDAASVFYDFAAFGVVLDARDHMERIAKSAELLEEEIVIGERPKIFYFTGKHEIVSAETAIGTVTAGHNYSYSMPGPDGIKLENKIYLSIAPKEPATLAQAVENVNIMLRFLEVIAGRSQTVIHLMFLVEDAAGKTVALDVYWCMPPNRHTDHGGRGPNPGDLPIQAARSPDYFSKVLTAWLARHDEWSSARFRFSSCMASQHRFTIDRIVGAANMFDILPDSAVPAKVVLPSDVKDVKKICTDAFKELPKSPERDSILNALGRLGRSSLRQKILSRAKLILDQVPERFPELELVIGEAVDCRNYFVHGSKTKIDYGKDFSLVTFYTLTLEFIFAASDLLECGWDIKEWTKQGSTLSHPFDQFRYGYQQGLAELKKALAEAKSSK